MTTATTLEPRRVRKGSSGDPLPHSGRRRVGRVPLRVAVAGGVVLVAGAAALSVFVGVQSLAPVAVLDALRGAPVDGETSAVVSARVARTLIALVVGASVALSGVVLQGLTRTRSRSPASSGSTRGPPWRSCSASGSSGSPVTGMSCRPGRHPAGGRAGAVPDPDGAARQRHGLAGARGRGSDGLSQSLIGAVLVTDRGALDSFRFWQVGSVAGRDAGQVLDVLPFLVVVACWR